MIKFFLLMLLFLPTLVFSQSSRWIDIEWDAVPDAKDYEVELFQDGDKDSNIPRGKYKTESPAWSHAVAPGKYSLRIRSLDKRGVPGEWSDFIPVKVRMQNPQLLRPVMEDKVDTPQIKFEWGDIPGAAQYQLVIKGSSGEVLHNSISSELKSTVFLEGLGKYSWAVFALEKNEKAKLADEWLQNAFKNFTRVGGQLEAPHVSIDISAKVDLQWSKIRTAQYYEIDYLPPVNSGDRNRRFKLSRNTMSFDQSKLKEGTTTLTVKAGGAGYQDSPKSIVQIAKSGSKIELEDIIQGKKEEVSKLAPTRAYFRDQYYVSVALGLMTYASEDIEKDTLLEQEKLTALGLNFEWIKQPRLNSMIRKLDFSVLNMSSGLESGQAIHLGYTYSWFKNWNGKKFTYGAGLSALRLPAFMGDRIEDSIKVEHSTSLGPEIILGYNHPLASHWSVQSNLNFAYHPFYLSSSREEGKAYHWIKGQVRLLRYITDNQAIYLGAEYQMWKQAWSDDFSEVSGPALNLGFKAGF